MISINLINLRTFQIVANVRLFKIIKYSHLILKIMNIKIYGSDWCSDCVIVKNFLDSKGITYEYIIINDNKEFIDLVEKINKGKELFQLYLLMELVTVIRELVN